MQNKLGFIFIFEMQLIEGEARDTKNLANYKNKLESF